MTNNFNSDAAKALIFDETNVTKTNIPKDLLQIITKLGLIVVMVYLILYFSAGIIIQSLSTEKQVQLENLLSVSHPIETIELSDNDNERLSRVRNKILELDENFPKTSKLEIKVIKSCYLNALCYPNGNIYITSELYKRLLNDDELCFVIAHEMAHYRNKDHLTNLRKSIAGAIVIITVSAVTQNTEEISRLIDSGLTVSELKYSRQAETKADKYAANIITKLYGSKQAGINVMNILDKNNHIYESPEILSSHPTIKKRIKALTK